MNEFNENNNQPSPIEPQVITPDIQKPQVAAPEYQQTQYETYQNIQPPNESKGMAIASMVLGIVALVFSCCWYLGIPCAIVGLILGIISLNKKQGGKGMALTGVILSGIALLLGLVIAIMAISATSYGTTNFWNEFNDSFDFGDFYDM